MSRIDFVKYLYLRIHHFEKKLCLSYGKCGIFHFRFHYVFIKVYFFLQQKSGDHLTLKRHNSFQYQNNRKATIFFPDL